MPALTKAQLAVITSAGEHLLVHAGAGSGKTTTIVHLLARQLGVSLQNNGCPIEPVQPPLRLDQVAAITYTNQAAADLKRKLRAVLRAGGQRDLAADVDTALVGTIHGFCGDLLRDYALRAGHAPARRVLEEGEASALLAESARHALREVVEQGGLADLDALLEGRKLSDVTRWVAELASDSGRLQRLVECSRAGSIRPQERALVSVAERAAARHAVQLDWAGALDFDRMIVATRDLLRSADVRHAVQQRLRLLVLDEFQDVDPAQREIAYLLGGLAEADPHPSRLVLVGDPKQSIYAFRRADVTLWSEVARDFGAGKGRILPLDANFRSKAAILAFADHVLKPLMDAPASDDTVRRPFEVDYQALDAQAEHAQGDHAVEILTVPAAADGKRRNAGEIRSLEFQTVARRIRELHLQGRAYGDIAILLAGWGAADVLGDALRKAGVPFYVLRSEGFWDTREVLDCVLALRAIRDARDDVAVAGFLKSPFIGVRDDTLLAIARERKNGEALSQAMQRVSHERSLLDLAQSLLDRLGALRDRVTVHHLLDRLLDETAFRVALVLDPHRGQQAMGNVRKLQRLAAGSAERSLGEFLRLIADQRGRDERVAPERLYRERADVVTISSVHSAKGLEWPVVFWCDLVRESRASAEELLIGRGALALRVREPDEDKATKDPRWEELRQGLAAEARAEAYRLWYVACTRAREQLVVSGVALGTARGEPFSAGGKLVSVLPPLEDIAEIEYQGCEGSTFHATVRVCNSGAEAEDPLESEAPELPLPPVSVPAPTGSRRLSASQLMTYARDPKLWWNRHVLLLGERPERGCKGGAPDSTTVGSAVHRGLERYDPEGVDMDELVEDGVAYADPDAPHAESAAGIELRQRIRARVESAVNSPAWQALARAGTARRELSFTRLLPDGTVMHGAMDLVAREGDRVRILDVKAGGTGADDLASRYVIQADTYVDAVRAISGTDQVEFVLLQVPSGVEVPVQPAGTLPAVIQGLRAFNAPGEGRQQ